MVEADPQLDEWGRDCPRCEAGNDQLEFLFLLACEGSPPGHENHDFAYSHSVVLRCRSCGEVYLEKYHHDCFDWDSVHDQYWWYQMGNNDAARLRQSIEECPDPRDGTCDCPVHENLRWSLTILPSEAWRSGLEHDRHLHTVKVLLREVRTPILIPGRDPP